MLTTIFEIVLGIFGVCILGIVAGALLAVIDTVRETEPEINEKKTLSACLTCRMRKWCIDSVQHHDATDDCYEEAIEWNCKN